MSISAPLITHHTATIVANGGSRVQAHDGSAVLANQGNLLALDQRLTLDLFLYGLSFCPVNENLLDLSLQDISLEL